MALAAAPAQARWHGHHGRGHHGGGWGAGAAGFAAGALIGGALGAAASRPYYYDYGYDYAPGPVVVGPSGGSAEAYCEQRFRSYNPATGMYLGYDGRHHPCP